MKRGGPILILISVIAIRGLAASELERREGFFWGGGLGGAYLERTFSHTNGVDDATARLYMEFFGGYAINPNVAIGLEIGGWLISPDSDTYVWNPYWPPDNERAEEPAGEGLSQILAFTRVYPYHDRGLFLKLGGGYMDHWWKTSHGYYDEQGWTAVAGVGWDIHLSGNWSLTPALSYSHGVAGSQTHQALTASIGFLWHQWKGPNRFDLESSTALMGRNEPGGYPCRERDLGAFTPRGLRANEPTLDIPAPPSQVGYVERKFHQSSLLDKNNRLSILTAEAGKATVASFSARGRARNPPRSDPSFRDDRR